MLKLYGACFGFALVMMVPALAQEIDMQVQLTAPLGTDVSRKGDAITARVISPLALQGDLVDGRVNQSKSGNKLTGSAVLSFSFDRLHHGGQAVPISAQVKSMTNSKGQQEVDEEGRVVRRSTGNLAKAAAGTGIGGLIGGLAGGGKGAAIGAVSGAAVSVVLIEVACQGPSVHFAAGSQVFLSVKSRGGAELSTLSPNTPQVAAAAPVPAPAGAPVVRPAPLPTAGAPSALAGQPDLVAVKADFITGAKTIFYDDFTDMAGDEPPPHWKVRGTAAELRTSAGIRQLTFKGERVTVSPNLKSLPKNFTMEIDFKIEPGSADCRPELEWFFHDKSGQNAMHLRTKQEPGQWTLRLDSGEDVLAETDVPVDWNQVVKLAVWVQNGRVRLYVNEKRVFDVNQVNLPELGTVEAGMWTGDKAIGYRFAQFAESMPDFSQMISSSGRYVTHGILFDTDSEHLQQESAAVIQSVARGLIANPNLKLEIEGHTDSSGSADHNLDLSKRRAEAVKAVLVSQFNVDASRLISAGMGATKPVEANDTPQGRAQNRRVEFVRQ